MTGIYSLLEGKTLGGRYHIGRLISKGGMGAVFRATDQQLGRAVAVKVIAIEPETPEQAARLRARFRREAHAVAGLRHANVVTLHDFGTDEAMCLDFIVMELLEGEDIQRRVRRTGPLSWKQASRILYEAGRGLGAGHRAGLVHRDVKSANLFLEQGANGKPVRTRVLDFGIAQLASEGTGTATHLTVLGNAPLSPPYASPEQQRGVSTLTPAADVWGLGVTAFEMLTGSLPFNEVQRAELAAGARLPPPSVAALNPSVPPAADDLIRRALSVNPAERPTDGEAFARQISAIRRSLQPASAPLPPPLSTPTYAETAVLETSERRQSHTPAAPVAAIAPALPNRLMGALVLLVSAGIVAVLAWTQYTGPVPDGTAVAASLVNTSVKPSYAATEGEIGYIREVYQAIENTGQSFSQRRVELDELRRSEWPSADSVYATAYDAGYGVQRIRVRAFQSGDRTSLLLYYDEGKLVFVHQVFRSPYATGNIEQRFYFRDRALIRWRDTNNSVVPLGPAYDEQARTLLRISDHVLARAGYPVR